MINKQRNKKTKRCIESQSEKFLWHVLRLYLPVFTLTIFQPQDLEIRNSGVRNEFCIFTAIQ